MPVYKIEFYEKTNGECPVFEFLKTLPPKIKAKIDRDIGILKEFNIKLRVPLVKPLGDGIFELRTQTAGFGVRTLYFFFDGQKIILTNGFIKKTDKTPTKEIEKAIEYKKDYEKRSGQK